MMFSADDIETLQKMFVQAFCFDAQSKFASAKFVTVVKLWTKEREVCHKIKYRISKWRNGHPCLPTALFGTALQKGVWT
jgi:hypothetical protein